MTLQEAVAYAKAQRTQQCLHAEHPATVRTAGGSFARWHVIPQRFVWCTREGGGPHNSVHVTEGILDDWEKVEPVLPEPVVEEWPLVVVSKGAWVSRPDSDATFGPHPFASHFPKRFMGWLWSDGKVRDDWQGWKGPEGYLTFSYDHAQLASMEPVHARCALVRRR